MSDRPPFADAGSRRPLYSDEFDRLLADGSRAVTTTDSPKRIDGAVVGTLVALTENGGLPLVTYQGQPGTAALSAQTTIDLHAAHIGRRAVLMFEAGDASRPIVIGCLRESAARPVPDLPDSVQIQADGERLIVSANDQLVLRCGKASITLTRAGKIIIEGAYVSNRSSGVLRLRGGSVQIN